MAKPLTEEQKQRRAEIARANGRKSKGPVTAAGKHRSSMNAITVGKFVEVHEHDLPPFVANLTAKDRKAYINLYQSNLRNLRPNSEHELWLVRSISAEQFQFDRHCKIEALALKADRDHVRNRDTDLTSDELELGAFERHASGDRIFRILDRKKKQHLAAYEKFTRLLLRMQKDRPALENEPVCDTPEILADPIETKQVAPNSNTGFPAAVHLLLTDLPESVTFNQQQKRNSRV